MGTQSAVGPARCGKSHEGRLFTSCFGFSQPQLVLGGAAQTTSLGTATAVQTATPQRTVPGATTASTAATVRAASREPRGRVSGSCWPSVHVGSPWVSMALYVAGPEGSGLCRVTRRVGILHHQAFGLWECLCDEAQTSRIQGQRGPHSSCSLPERWRRPLQVLFPAVFLHADESLNQWDCAPFVI